jgi:hypothetical protein
MRALVSGIAILGALTSTVQPRPQGLRWSAHAVIPVWVETVEAPPFAAALVGQALATWTHAAAGRFVLREASARDTARIRVRFARADGLYGEAAPRIDPSTGMIGSADVLIAGDVPGDAMRQRIVIYLTALHELGHAIGLPHTAAFDDIMYSFRRPDDGERYFGAYQRRLRTAADIGSPHATGLSSADIAALAALYDR